MSMDMFEEIKLLKMEYAELSNHLCELEREEQEVDELIASAQLERQKIEEETMTLLRWGMEFVNDGSTERQDGCIS